LNASGVIFVIPVTSTSSYPTSIPKSEFARITIFAAVSIKLIGEVQENRDSQDNRLRVAPKMVPRNHPLNIGGTFNLASIQTELAGRITIGGIGAGSIETASAILSDILWIAGVSGE